MSPPLLPVADRRLASLAGQVDLLLDVSPTNTDEAWERSVACAHRRPLDLRYRPIQTDVDGLREALADLDLDLVGDDDAEAALAPLLEAKRRDLAQQVELIAARSTPAFLERSVAMFGPVDDDLLAVATSLLDRLDPEPPGPDGLIGPQEFADRARVEVARYREQLPELRATVSVRDDVSSLMVVQRDVLVGTDSWIPAHRCEALVHHEVGTHLLTAATGGEQPLTLLEHGLADYEETQEALGVLAEHLVGGMDAERMVTLAARVLGARRVEDGADFPELFAELHEEHGLPEHRAWTIAVRLVRGGGFTKDLIYLRGLLDLVAHLEAGGDLAPLLAGKLALRDADAVEGLISTGRLHPPALRPHWLDGPGPTERLAALRRGEAPVERWPLVGAIAA